MPNKKILVFLFKLVVSALLVWYIVKNISVNNLTAGINTSHLYIFIINFLIVTACIFIKSWRWHKIISTEFNYSFRASLESYIAGQVGGIFTPGRVGEISRVLFLEAKDRYILVPLVILEKAMELVVVVLFSAWAINYFAGAAVASVFVTVLILGLAVFSVVFFRIDLNKFNLPAKIKNIAEVLQKIASAKLLAGLLSLTAFSFLLIVVEYYLFVSLGVSTKVSVILVVLPLMVLTNLIPFTINGLGLREVVSVYVLGGFGIPEFIALRASLLLFVFNLVFPAVLGAVLMWRGREEQAARIVES